MPTADRAYASEREGDVKQHRTQPRTKVSGFTLVESIVAIGIVSLLGALLLPAVQGVRETARQQQCASHLRQIGLATHDYTTARGKFPPYIRNPVNNSGPPEFSFITQILPQLGQSTLFFSLEWERVYPMPPVSPRNPEALRTHIPIFRCPSDDGPLGSTNYRVNEGTSVGSPSWRNGQSPRPTPPGEAELYGYWAPWTIDGPASISDGMSQTVLASERLIGDGHPEIYTPARDLLAVNGHLQTIAETISACLLATGQESHSSILGYSWLPNDKSMTSYNHIFAPNSRIPDCVDHWADHSLGQGAISARSWHRGSVTCVMGDGAVRKVHDEIDLHVWRAIGTSYGAEIVSDF
ncbi:MAG: DUF1559 domain-containing protein [Planctomycetota bacterium]|nr:MAG: DUF1559 domain-containing protein [Planctomycetota bacterium]